MACTPKTPGKSLNNFPLPCELNNDHHPGIHDKVDQVLSLKKQNPKADTSAIESEIDQLVYALYDLTPEEVALVEGAAQQPSPAMEEVSE